MKKLFLITIVLLLQSFPSFGNPNGKGLWCNLIEGVVFKYVDKEQTFVSELGFRFLNDMVKMGFLNLDEGMGEVLPSETDLQSFKTTERKIKWVIDSGTYELNRRSLILNIKHPNGGSKFQCKVYKSNINYHSEFEKLRKKHQKNFEIIFSQSKNKI